MTAPDPSGEGVARSIAQALAERGFGIEAFNLGSGEGTSVLELVHAFSRACGHDLPYVVDGRRDGGDAGSGQRDLRRACEFEIAVGMPRLFAGAVYADDTVRRLAAMPCAAPRLPCKFP